MKNAFNYVDTFVLPVSKKKLIPYKKMSKLMAKICIDNGALSYVESMADDVAPGKVTSFPQSVKLKKDETVFISFITYKNRKHRDVVMNKIMADPRMSKMGDESLVDGMRMFWGGFKPIVRA